MPDAAHLFLPTPVVVRHLYREALQRLHEARRGLADAPEDPESVHAVRVALTRLREATVAWTPLGVPWPGAHDLTVLRDVHRALGRVRTDDVRRAQLLASAAPVSPRDANGAATGAREHQNADSPELFAAAAGDASTVNDALRALVERLDRRRARRLARALRLVALHLDPWLEAAQSALDEPIGGEVAPHDDLPKDDLALANAHAGAADAPPFHRALERALQVAGQRVLDATDHGSSTASRHRARLALKRVRALVHPWLDATPSLAPLMRIATAGQDLLGDERDLEGLRRWVDRALRRERRRGRARRRDRRRRLRTDAAALHRRLHDAAVRASLRVDREWLAAHGPSRVALHLALAAASAALRSLRADAAEPDGDDARDRHSSAPAPVLAVDAAVHEAAPTDADRPSLEIERKFLLRALPEHVCERAGVRIAQGWLPGERLRERLRRTVHPDGRVEWTRTVKLGAGLTRIEVEEATDPILFESLWPFTSAARIEKIRYAVPDGPVTWEIDRFLDRPLVLAEVELPSAETMVSPPAWLAPYIVRDVTDEADYVNANLARRRGYVPDA